MSLPVDPTAGDVSPLDILMGLPSRAALRRALAAANIADELDDDDDPEQFLGALSQVELRQAATQARYAAPQTVHYFQLSDLLGISRPELDDLTDKNGFGGQIRAVEELHNRTYVVCSVPEGGTQAQLSVSDDNRVTTVATFDPQSELLAVRAEDAEVADGTVHAFRAHPDLSGGFRVSFQDDGVRGRFEDAAVIAYEQLSLGVTGISAQTDRIDITGTVLSDSKRGDVRRDDVIDDLLSRGDTERKEGHVQLNLGSDAVPAKPKVQMDFDANAITFRQWVPERTLIQLDQIVQQAI